MTQTVVPEALGLHLEILDEDPESFREVGIPVCVVLEENETQESLGPVVVHTSRTLETINKVRRT